MAKPEQPAADRRLLPQAMVKKPVGQSPLKVVRVITKINPSAATASRAAGNNQVQQVVRRAAQPLVGTPTRGKLAGAAVTMTQGGQGHAAPSNAKGVTPGAVGTLGTASLPRQGLPQSAPRSVSSGGGASVKKVVPSGSVQMQSMRSVPPQLANGSVPQGTRTILQNATRATSSAAGLVKRPQVIPNASALPVNGGARSTGTRPVAVPGTGSVRSSSATPVREVLVTATSVGVKPVASNVTVKLNVNVTPVKRTVIGSSTVTAAKKILSPHAGQTVASVKQVVANNGATSLKHVSAATVPSKAPVRQISTSAHAVRTPIRHIAAPGTPAKLGPSVAKSGTVSGSANAASSTGNTATVKKEQGNTVTVKKEQGDTVTVKKEHSVAAVGVSPAKVGTAPVMGMGSARTLAAPGRPSTTPVKYLTPQRPAVAQTRGPSPQAPPRATLAKPTTFASSLAQTSKLNVSAARYSAHLLKGQPVKYVSTPARGGATPVKYVAASDRPSSMPVKYGTASTRPNTASVRYAMATGRPGMVPVRYGSGAVRPLVGTSKPGTYVQKVITSTSTAVQGKAPSHTPVAPTTRRGPSLASTSTVVRKVLPGQAAALAPVKQRISVPGNALVNRAPAPGTRLASSALSTAVPRSTSATALRATPTGVTSVPGAAGSVGQQLTPQKRIPAIPPEALAAAAAAAAAVEPTPPLEPRTSVLAASMAVPAAIPAKTVAVRANLQTRPQAKATPLHPKPTVKPAAAPLAVPAQVNASIPIVRAPKVEPKIVGEPAKIPEGMTFEAGEHVTMWNRIESRKIAGNAAPLGKNVGKYLKAHPECEVYEDQDQDSKGGRKRQRIDPSEAAAGDHISIWNKRLKRKIAGNAAPLAKNLEAYLAKRPDCEVYHSQDQEMKGQRADNPLPDPDVEDLDFPEFEPDDDDGEALLDAWKYLPSQIEDEQRSVDHAYESLESLLKGDDDDIVNPVILTGPTAIEEDIFGEELPNDGGDFIPGDELDKMISLEDDADGSLQLRFLDGELPPLAGNFEIPNSS